MRLVLYQPDIAPNAGTMLRLAACAGVAVDVIEPAGFVFDGPQLRRSAMDYLDNVTVMRHASFAAFRVARPAGRLVLLTTQATLPYFLARYREDDLLMVGRETAGVPPEIHAAAGLRVRIPIQDNMRSLNVAVAAAIVLGEALRQTDLWPGSRVDG